MADMVKISDATRECGLKKPETLVRALAKAGFHVPSPGRGVPRLVPRAWVERALAARTVSIGRGLGSLRPRPPSI